MSERDEPGATLPEGVQLFDLTRLTEQVRSERGYQEGGRGAAMLVKAPGLRALVEVLRAGATLAEHHAPGPITVHVLTGELRFGTGGEWIPIPAGTVLFLSAGRPHSVEAVQDSTFLLTIAPAPEGVHS